MNVNFRVCYIYFYFFSREGNEKSYQLLRDSLDLYLTISPDNVQYLLLQARLYFHLGIWPEKVNALNNITCVSLSQEIIVQHYFLLRLCLAPYTLNC